MSKKGQGKAYQWVLAHQNYAGDDCLPWPFSTASHGGAQIWHESRLQFAARLICALIHGPAPSPTHHAAHSCGKGHEGCVNGSHISWKTPAENEADKLIHGTHNRGERNGQAKLTESIVREILSMKGKLTQHKIAEMVGINPVTVHRIHNKERWAWLDGGVQ